MLHLILFAAMFLPHQEVKLYPYPDPKCLYQWISDETKLENTCADAIVLDVAYKNGLGTHTVLKKGDVLTLLKPPMKLFACTVNKGLPSGSPTHYVHPGFKTDKYVCLDQKLVFPDPPTFTIKGLNIE